MSQPNEPKEHRFAFARRWEKKKQTRSTRRAWMVMLIDLALLALVSLLGYMLIERLT